MLGLKHEWVRGAHAGAPRRTKELTQPRGAHAGAQCGVSSPRPSPPAPSLPCSKLWQTTYAICSLLSQENEGCRVCKRYPGLKCATRKD